MKKSNFPLRENLLFEEDKHEELDDILPALFSPDFEDLSLQGSYNISKEIPLQADLYTTTAGFDSSEYLTYSSESVANTRSLYNIPGICPICSLDIVSNEIFRIPECNHIFCISCGRQYLETRINESQVLTMPCPDYNCIYMIPDYLIARVLNDEILQKYQRFKKEAELTSRANLRWCPKPDCEGYDLGGTRKKKLTCNVCSSKYCYYCGELWNENHPKCNATNDFQLDAWSRKHEVKHCPNCKRRIEKMEGCNHMTCSKCRYEWCWLCGAKYHPNHFAECEVLKITKQDVPWKIISLVLLGPLLGLFSCVIVIIGLILDLYRVRVGHYGCRRFTELFFILLISVPLALALSPIAFGVMFVISGPYAISQMINENRFRLSEASYMCQWCIKYILGICISPIVSVLAVAAVVVSPAVGLVLVVYKLYIYIRRCWDRDYLNPRGYGDY